MLKLPDNPTLADYQAYVTQLESDRGFSDQNAMQKCLLLTEELGELCKAVRKSQNIKIDENSNVQPVEEELADILIYTCSIANRFDIDLEKAFRAKEEVNKKRVWR